MTFLMPISSMERMSNTSRSCSCTKRRSPVSTLRMPTWRTQCGLMAGDTPPICSSSRGPKPQRQETGMPCRLPLGREFARVEIGMRVQPQHAQGLAPVAAMTRDRRDRADAQGMIAAEQNRQPLLAQLSIYRVVHLMVPRRHLRKIAVAVHLDQSGIRRPADIAAIHDVEAALRQRRVDAGDAQRLGTHGGAAVAGADIRRRADETGGTCRGRHHANLPAARGRSLMASPANRSFGSSSSGMRSMRWPPSGCSAFKRCK